MSTREVRSVCRYCAGACGVIATLDDSDRMVALRGDREHPLTAGFVCSKGLQSVEAMNGEQRIVRPLKRMPDGSFVEIALETALDEIAAKLRHILDEDGPDAIGLFKGTQTWKNPTAHQMMTAWLQSLGSSRMFSTLTIDQSAKQVTMGRMGYWDAGRPKLEQCDVMMIIGGNPQVSLAIVNFLHDPVKRIKKARERGTRFIAIDPRRSELAQQSALHLQPKPGEDASIIAGLIRIILSEGWHDQAFCDRYVEGLGRLREMVEPFTPEYVARRADIAAEDLRAVASLFARESRTGIAVSGTGLSMGPHSNVADHLAECLNAICGRYLREGNRILNPGVQNKRREYRAQVVPPNRTWETGPKTSGGHGQIFGELMSGVLADEMLLQGPGRLRALIVNGGNPAVALPDQKRAVAGMQALDLLVAVEPYMTATAQLCHYILPPKLQFERTDTAVTPHYEQMFDVPFVQYVPAIVAPPAGADVADDWYVYWALAKRLGYALTLSGVELDMQRAPTTEDLLAILLKDSQIPFNDIKGLTTGAVIDTGEEFVKPALPGADARLMVMPDDVAGELQQVIDEYAGDGAGDYPFRLVVRRLRGVMNSLGIGMSGSKRLHPVNNLFIHPEDLAALGLGNGDAVRVETETGSLQGLAQADDTLRRGVVAMSHCWGGLPTDADSLYRQVGVSTNLLVRTDRNVEAVNAMPQLTSLPVRLAAGVLPG